MSWQAYVDQQLIGTGHVKQGALVGLDGSVWAYSAGFNPGDTRKLVSQFANNQSVFSEGVNIGGIKYMGIRADARSIYGKKGATGCVCVKTNQCVIVAIYNETIQPGSCTTVVEKLADYLIENNF